MEPTLHAYIKTHKENEPIRAVVNNIHTPSYKTAKHLNKKLWGHPHVSASSSIQLSRTIHLSLSSLVRRPFSGTQLAGVIKQATPAH